MEIHQHLLSNQDKNLLDLIKNLDYKEITTGKYKDDTPYLKHVFRLYTLLFGGVCSSCPNNIPIYIETLKKINRMQDTKEKKAGEFQLKKGVIIPIKGTSKAYSEHNITDEIALNLLKENPNRISLFSKTPEDINEMLEGHEEAYVEIFDYELSIDQANLLLERIGIESRATTVKGVEKKLESLSTEDEEKIKEILYSEEE
ncbi:hypothetical protein ACFSTE_13325 [Aquimarina hainanensis]|uniref:Uncharacterized protein n=1 Tax=Aquimarina hainanensis TaxID=1578017 RepID=A0ABW5N8D2_9FLAO